MNIWTSWLDALRSLVDALSTEAGLGWAWPSSLRRCCFAYSCSRYPVRCLLRLRSPEENDKTSTRAPAAQGEVRERAQPVHAANDEVVSQARPVGRRRQKSFGRTCSDAAAARHVSGTSKRGRWSSRFLWVPNLFKPDVLFALIAGVTTALMITANPDLPEQMRLFMILVPSASWRSRPPSIFALRFRFTGWHRTASQPHKLWRCTLS